MKTIKKTKPAFLLTYSLIPFWLSLLFLLQINSSNAAVVIQYHHISDDTPGATSTSPDLFKNHLAYLEEHNYNVVPLPELAKILRTKNRNLPDKTIAITFDDGYTSIYTHAFPELQKRGWPFTIFVNTRPIDQNLSQFVNWEQLQEMAQEGATIANHSFSHSHFLRRLKNEGQANWQKRITEDITTTQESIQTNIQTDQKHEIKLLAYPYGEFDENTKQLVKDLGYIAFGQQSGPLSIDENLQALPRFPFGGNYGDINDFATKVASKPLPRDSVTIYMEDGTTELNDTVLPAGVKRPILSIRLTGDSVIKNLQCYASGQGEIEVRLEQNIAVTQAGKDLLAGRSRYNCTAPSSEAGRFYWYSHVFIKKDEDGEWHPEL